MTSMTILSIIAEEFDVSINEMLGKKRDVPLPEIRHLTALLLRRIFKYKFIKIAALLNRHYSSIMSGIHTAEGLIDIDPDYRRKYNILFNKLTEFKKEIAMNLKPLYHHVVIKPDDPDSKYGEIWIAETGQQPKRTGYVVAVGEGRLTNQNEILPLRVKPGDKVLFGEYSGLPFDWEGIEYKHMREDEIIAIILEDRDDSARI